MSTYVGKLFTAVSSALEFNTATLSGAMDIVVIEDTHGNRQSTPFHVRFGKLQLLKSRGIAIDIDLNSNRTQLRMLLGAAGEAYFYNPPHSETLPQSPIRLDDPTASAPDLDDGPDPNFAVDLCADAAIRPISTAQSSASTLDNSSSPEVTAIDQSDLALPVRSATSPHPIHPHPPSDLMLEPSLSNLSVSASSQPFVLQPPLSMPLSKPSPSKSAIHPADSYDLFAYVSDSEVELTRTHRDADSQLVIGGPLSPPVLPSRRSWTPSNHQISCTATITPLSPPLPPPTLSPLSAPQRQGPLSFAPSPTQLKPPSSQLSPSLPSVRQSPPPLTSPLPPLPPSPPLTASLPPLPLLVSPPLPPTSSLPPLPPSPPLSLSLPLLPSSPQPPTSLTMSLPPLPPSPLAPSAVLSSSTQHLTPPLQGTSNEDAPAAGDSTDLEGSALFDLPASPLRRDVAVNSRDVTVSATIHDVVGEEDRKLEMRSVDGYDADDDDVDATIDGLQQHVTQVLSSDKSLCLERYAVPIDTEVTEGISSPPSDADPPSDRDDLLVLSLCGGLLTPDMQEAEVMELFERHRVSFAEFSTNPNLLFDPTLRFRIDNRIVELRVVAPMVVAALAFSERMDVDVLARLTAPRNEERKEALKSPPTLRRFGWFGWSSASPTVVGEPLLNEEEVFAVDEKKGEFAVRDGMGEAVVEDGKNPQVNGTNAAEEEIRGGEDIETTTKLTDDQEGGGEAKSEEERLGTERDDDNEEMGVSGANEGRSEAIMSEENAEFLSLRPTGEQLKELDLKPGANIMRFFVEASSVELHCRVFLWQCHSKIVISDVDGTITRSDVLGHLLPAVGRDWSQVGVAGLYTQIEKNGYKMLYLTARPIGQASQTRAFLHSVTQGSTKLPNGPVLMSPNRLVESFTREVIRRKPHEFKIAALREVRNLFSPDYNPFHAGFGNRDTDVVSYRAVGLIPQRIFVVNPKGELVVMKAKYESAASYSTLQHLVESVFPDISGQGGREKIKALTDNATYNDWNYWRGELPAIDFDQLLGNT